MATSPYSTSSGVLADAEFGVSSPGASGGDAFLLRNADGEQVVFEVRGCVAPVPLGTIGVQQRAVHRLRGRAGWFDLAAWVHMFFFLGPLRGIACQEFLGGEEGRG